MEIVRFFFESVWHYVGLLVVIITCGLAGAIARSEIVKSEDL